MTKIQLNYVALIVSDMKKALDFYRLLGLPIPADMDTTQDHLEIEVNGLRIAWETEALMRKLDQTWTPPTRAGRLGIGVEADSPAEVDQVIDKVKAAGYQIKAEPYDAFWGQRYATVLDPDGTAVDVFAGL